ncbi:MAG: MOSC domain-containing protein [Pararhizobium sp.]
MDTLIEPLSEAIEILPGRRLQASAAGLFAARGNDFATSPVAELDFGFDGIAEDFHSGLTRRSGGREPWYPRGTEMRNERQVSLVAADELAEAASAMGIAEIRPEWIGANLVVAGIPRLSMLPPRTLFFFEGGVTLRIDGQNAPCRLSGNAIADHYPDRDRTKLALAFKDGARRRRGLVAWVEKPGRVVAGERISVLVPEQWLYH